MNGTPFLTLKITFGSLAVLAGFLAAWFELRDRAQTDAERQKTRAYYGAKWITIQQSDLLELPERVILWILAVKDKAMYRLKWHPARSGFFHKGLYYSIPIIGFICTVSEFGWISTIALFISLFSIIVCISISLTIPNSTFIKAVGFGALFIFYMLIGLIIVRVILNLSIGYATLLILLIAPFLGLFLSLAFTTLAFSMPKIRNWRDPGVNIISVFGFTMAISFAVTILSLLIGHLAEPKLWIPQTFQMLFSNVVFDGLTMLTTLWILSAAVGNRRRFSIPIAILLDILVAALLAIGSLYFGLLFSSNAISLLQTSKILVGLSNEGPGFALGPYFWAMHTTFLPTLLYLGIIFFCWIGKLFVLPIAQLFRKGELVDKPHHLTAGVFLLIATVFLGVSNLCGYLHEAAN